MDYINFRDFSLVSQAVRDPEWLISAAYYLALDPISPPFSSFENALGGDVCTYIQYPVISNERTVHHFSLSLSLSGQRPSSCMWYYIKILRRRTVKSKFHVYN